MYKKEIRDRMVIDKDTWEKKVEKFCEITAGDILRNGSETIENRAEERDIDRERSMKKTVKTFNAMYGKDLTEVEGWQFMVMLKMCRASQGKFRMDDYQDQASYSALAAEAADKEDKDVYKNYKTGE